MRQCVLDLMTLNHRVPRFEPWCAHQVLQAPFETRRLKRLFKRCFCQSGEQPNLDDNVIGFVAPTSKAVLAEQSIWSTETLSPPDLEQTPLAVAGSCALRPRRGIAECAGASHQEVTTKARAQLERLADLYATPTREAELIAIFKEAIRLEADSWKVSWRAGQCVE